MDWASIILPLAVAVIAAVPGVLAYANAKNMVRKEEQETAMDAWQALLEPLRTELKELKATKTEQGRLIAELRQQVDALTIANRRLQIKVDEYSRRMTAYYRQLVDAGATPNADYIGRDALTPGEADYASVAAGIEAEMATEAAEDRMMAAYRQQLIDAGIEPNPDYVGGAA